MASIGRDPTQSNANLLDEARAIIAAARADLGHDLGGYSLVDLLLDNMPELRGSAEARLLIAIGDLD